MDHALLILVLLIGVALLFDFLNGLHDAANSIATIVSTRVLAPRYAVFWAAFFNFVAFLVFGLHVAGTVGSGIIDVTVVNDRVILGALGGAIVWNLVTWYAGIPSSSSHALIGGLLGAGVAKAGLGAIVWPGVIATSAAIVLSPALGFVLALQMYYALVTYGAAESLGLIVNLSLTRELGPVVTALLFAGLTLWELRRGLTESSQRMLLAAFALTGCWAWLTAMAPTTMLAAYSETARNLVWIGVLYRLSEGDREHGGQRAPLARHVGDEPAGLHLGRRAEVVEVVGAARDPRRPRRVPARAEPRVEEVAALRGLDEGEGHARLARRVPVDGALIARHVDAVHGQVGGREARPVHGPGVAEGARARRGERGRHGCPARPAGREHDGQRRDPDPPHAPLPEPDPALPR